MSADGRDPSARTLDRDLLGLVDAELIHPYPREMRGLGREVARTQKQSPSYREGHLERSDALPLGDTVSLGALPGVNQDPVLLLWLPLAKLQSERASG